MFRGMVIKKNATMNVYSWHLKSVYWSFLKSKSLILFPPLVLAAQMIPLFKLFAGGPIGSGKQWYNDAKVNIRFICLKLVWEMINNIFLRCQLVYLYVTFELTYPKCECVHIYGLYASRCMPFYACRMFVSIYIHMTWICKFTQHCALAYCM